MTDFRARAPCPAISLILGTPAPCDSTPSRFVVLFDFLPLRSFCAAILFSSEFLLLPLSRLILHPSCFIPHIGSRRRFLFSSFTIVSSSREYPPTTTTNTAPPPPPRRLVFCIFELVLFRNAPSVAKSSFLFPILLPPPYISALLLMPSMRLAASLLFAKFWKPSSLFATSSVSPFRFSSLHHPASLISLSFVS